MSSAFLPVVAGNAEGADAPAPVTPTNVPHHGGPTNPTAIALRTQFGAVVQRVDVVWGETTVIVDAARVNDIVRWLHDDPSQRYDFCADVTAVEYRDMERPIEVVWHLRSLPFRRFLRLKALIPKGAPLEVPSVWDIHKSVDWLERECYDMFG
ncbi:MAG: NADH-quinone oxidoreductase subunit C, partial [bacterium]